jgi:hypothetical protein
VALGTCAAGLTLSVGLTGAAPPRGAPADQGDPSAALATATAQHAFYNGRYAEAADQARSLSSRAPDNLAAYELHSSALLFQVKNAVGSAADKRGALRSCATCPGLIAEFLGAAGRGRALAHARLQPNEEDLTALFLLGRIDLNYVWLHLDLLGQKKGLSEYWEARRSLDRVLDRDPQHVRAGVARAWIDYIVGTRIPRGTRWLLGGGNRTRALASMRALAESGEGFDRAEAMFGLWEIERREGNMEPAAAIAARLALDFPDNRELSTFLTSQGHPQPTVAVREEVMAAEGY